LGFHVRFGGNHADFPGLHAQRLQKLPHLSGLAHNPGQLSDLGRRFRHRRRRMLPEIAFQREAVFHQLTLRTIMLEALQLFDPTRHVRIEIAMEAGLGNAAQPGDVARGHPLTAQVEGFQPHLHPRVRVMKAPISQCVYLRFAPGDLDHGEHLG
jgi:hypothetical protein